MAGQFFGTPRYMSPEQALGQPVDARTDVFALGAVLYSLVTGRAAFDAKEVPMIFTQVARHDPPPPSHVVPSIPVELDYVVARALAKAPADRYPTAQAFGEDLEDLLAGRPPRHRPSWNAPTTPTGTIVSTLQAVQGGAAPGLPRRPTAASPAPAPTGVRRSTPVRPPPRAKAAGPSPARPVLWALAVLVAVGLGAFVFLQLRGHGPSDVPEAPPSTAVAGTAVPPDTLPRPLDPEFDALSTPPVPPATPPLPSTPETPGPTRKPRAAAPSTRSAAASPEPEAAALPAGKRARLLIDFEHPLKSGIVRLWLDGALLIEEDLEGRVTRNVAGLKLRKGGFEKEVELEPGRHTVRVQVKWEDNEKSDALTGTFDPGESRVLEIRVGRLRKNLSAEWR
jgi:serine/threonine-protein kinase